MRSAFVSASKPRRAPWKETQHQLRETPRCRRAGHDRSAAVESLAGRLIRLERRFDAEVEAEVVQIAKGQTLSQISKGMLAAIDPDKIAEVAKAELVGRASPRAEITYSEPTAKDLKAASEQLIKT